MPARTTRWGGGGGSASTRCSSIAVSSWMVISLPPGMAPPVSTLPTNWPSGSSTRPNNESKTPHAPHSASTRATSRHSMCPAATDTTTSARHIEWRLVALVLALWGAWGFFDSLFGWVLEPLGQFVGNALTGGGMPGGTVITIQDETVMLERLVDADPPPPPHRGVLAGIRLAEIYRTHEHDP